MSNYGYYRASQDALAAFRQQLEEAPWKAIDVTPFLKVEDQLAISILPLIKLRLQKRVDAVISALRTDSGELGRLDAFWDITQRKLNRRIDEGAESPDEPTRAAAARLSAALLLGNGLAQTLLPYEDEVNFGLKQLALLRAPKEDKAQTSLGEDAALLDLEKVIQEVEQRTKDLAAGLERVPAEATDTSRYNRIKLAVSDCIETLNHAHTALVEQIEGTSNAQTKATLQVLLDSLLSLIPTRPLKKPESSAPPK